MMKLTVIIPLYNERETISHVLEFVDRVVVSGIDSKEIIVVDDGSNDGSDVLVDQFVPANPHNQVHLIRHHQNFGKGRAIRTALKYCEGDFLIIQDADSEYDPLHYPELLAPLLKNEADVVYGSRYLGGKPQSEGPGLQYIANRFLTALSNLVTGFSLTDMETGFKVFSKNVYQQLQICERGFGVEPEINSKLSRIKGLHLKEVPIKYTGRSYKEGKKIGWKDGLRAIYCIFKYRFSLS